MRFHAQLILPRRSACHSGGLGVSYCRAGEDEMCRLKSCAGYHELDAHSDRRGHNDWWLVPLSARLEKEAARRLYAAFGLAGLAPV